MHRRIVRGGERFWRHTDFADLPAGAVTMALSRLAANGEIERVRKGLYFRPRETRFGQSQPAASAVAAQTLNAPVHPAGLTAANTLGFTTQNPARLEYATPANDAPSAVDNAVFHTRRPAARTTLAPEEGALLELLRDRARTSDLSPDDTRARLLELVSDPKTFERLTRAALDEPARVRAMLGALGQEAHADPRALAKLRKSINPLTRFDFGVLRGLRHAREWQAR